MAQLSDREHNMQMEDMRSFDEQMPIQDELTKLLEQELKRIVGDFAQIATAREIAPYLNIDINTSPSFRCFISGVRQMFI